MELETQTGKKQIRFLKFPALEGWDIQDRFAAFANSTDPAVRRAYVLRVLGFARVLVGQHELPLSTGALIDNHLCTADNVGAVFAGVMVFNGVDVKAAANRSDYMTAVGNEIATSFVSACMGALEQFIAFVSEDRSNV